PNVSRFGGGIADIGRLRGFVWLCHAIPTYYARVRINLDFRACLTIGELTNHQRSEIVRTD
ncbi:MAG TPA: hypothetical protein DDY28_00165, partial [Hyphomonas atlantica]|nr:hypothetical protein [Hyphomonas atlantica]